MYTYIHAQVIQNFTSLIRIDIYSVNGKHQDFYLQLFLCNRL